MNRQSSLVVGVALVSLGIASLLFSLVASLLGFNIGLFILRLWPLAIIGAGLILVVPPFLVRDKPGLGALFIAGLPVLMTGTVLLLASVFDAWGIWAWMWPLLLLSLAMGFVAAALYTRVVWFVIPATIIGLNGLAFAFCSVTGLWEWWAWLWVIEPLSVGLGLLICNIQARSAGLRLAGLILCGLAGAGLLLMMLVLNSFWTVSLLGSAVLILAGLAFLAWGLIRNLPSVRAVME